MAGNDSIFSFLKGAPGPGDGQQAPFPPPSATPIPPVPACPPAVVGRLEELGSALASMALKIEALEKRGVEPPKGHSVLPEPLLGRLSALEIRLAAAEKAASVTGMSSNRLSLEMDRLVEQSMGALRVNLIAELDGRIVKQHSSVPGALNKAAVAYELASGVMRRLEKLEERLARAAYAETRLDRIEAKFEGFCECEAAVEGLKVELGRIQGTVSDVAHLASVQAGEQKKVEAEFDAMSRQLAQLSALFNHFRVELGLLLSERRQAGSVR